ncbi:hypothetical protein HDG37_000190 [Paraburkholderia sp. MM5384-R2]|nr:hypothetical protein [Paraburkholderia sp. MM5384-R2]
MSSTRSSACPAASHAAASSVPVPMHSSNGEPATSV